MPDRSLTWAPRVCGVAFTIALVAVGAHDYAGGTRTATTIIALVMHLLLAAVVLVLVFSCWRREWIGGWVTILLGTFYLWTGGDSVAWGDTQLILGSLSILGLLYFWNAERRRHPGPALPRVSGATTLPPHPSSPRRSGRQHLEFIG